MRPVVLATLAPVSIPTVGIFFPSAYLDNIIGFKKCLFRYVFPFTGVAEYFLIMN